MRYHFRSLTMLLRSPFSLRTGVKAPRRSIAVTRCFDLYALWVLFLRLKRRARNAS